MECKKSTHTQRCLPHRAKSRVCQPPPVITTRVYDLKKKEEELVRANERCYPVACQLITSEM